MKIQKLKVGTRLLQHRFWSQHSRFMEDDEFMDAAMEWVLDEYYRETGTLPEETDMPVDDVLFMMEESRAFLDVVTRKN